MKGLGPEMLEVVGQVKRAIDDSGATDNPAATDLNIKLGLLQDLAAEPFQEDDLAERLVRDANQD